MLKKTDREQLMYSKLMSLSMSSPLQKWIQEMTKLRAPSGFHVVRRGNSTGGSMLKKKRLIKKWFKIRPGTFIPEGFSKKILREHKRVNWMYYREHGTNTLKTKGN